MIDLSLRGNEVTVAILEKTGLLRIFQSLAMTAYEYLSRGWQG